MSDAPTSVALLRSLIEREPESYRGVRVVDTRRAHDRDLVHYEIEIVRREGTTFDVDGFTLHRSPALADELASKLDDAAARLRATLVGQLISEPLKFADDPAQDAAIRRQLASRLTT